MRRVACGIAAHRAGATAATRLIRLRQLAQERAWRRNRWRTSAFRCGKITRRVIKRDKRRHQRNCACRTDHVDLWRRRLELRFFFGILSRVNDVTERTWMCAVERLSNRRAQWRVLRVLDNHRRPRHRLKRDPMQTDRAAERENRHDTANTANHATRLVSRPTNVNQWAGSFLFSDLGGTKAPLPSSR